MVDVHLAHPGAFHHRVERDEVFLNEAQQVHGVVFDGGLGLSHALETLEVRQQAEGHHLECLRVEVAEVEPVVPDRVEVLIEFPDFRDGVDLLRVVVPSVHQELEAAHHRRQRRAFRQCGRSEGLEKVAEISLAHLQDRLRSCLRRAMLPA